MTRGISLALMLALGVSSFSAPVMAGGVIGGLIGGAVGGAIGKGVGQAVTTTDVGKTLSVAAESVNKKTPIMVDAHTRLDGASAGPGRIFTYHNTFVNAALNDVDMTLFYGLFRRELRTRVCENKAMHPMLKLGVTAVYEYRSKDGQIVGSVSVTQKDCGL